MDDPKLMDREIFVGDQWSEEVLNNGMDLPMDLPKWTYDNVHIVYFGLKWTYDFTLKKRVF